MWYNSRWIQALIVVIVLAGICMFAKIHGTSVADEKGITVHVGK